MQKIVHVIFIASALSLAACGTKTEKVTVAVKKQELEKLKKEQQVTADKIKALEIEIAKMDTSAAKENVAKLVSTTPVIAQNFTHYIDLQGRVDAENISYVAPRMGPAQVKAVYVTKGAYVRKGQLLLKLDDAIVRQQVAASRQSTETIKSQINLARDIYNRRNNLWKQGIGTEVELITARTNVETLEKQLAAANENIKVQQEQLNSYNVYSDVNGIADEVNIRPGEIFSGAVGAAPQIRIVNTSTLKVITDVPENYSGKVRQGSSVLVTLPDINKTFNARINLSGQLIDPTNRSFRAEARLPEAAGIRPNQIAQVRILDYAAANAIAIPVNTVGTDEKGKFVYVAATEGGRLIARKRQIIVGELYQQLIEVKSGLSAGEQLITEGFQNIYDGQVLRKA
ncbi:MAG: efflux RND transporter periplasmic adaptor subunit [Chitinophagaceae bacterium]|nr:efflux RND transporter periplasmic adaptor subunit [Chitinophagaceae bacterium]